MIDVTESTFQQEVLERSHEAPVVVDFWAAWCGPCRALGPVLERLAAEADGAWTLAKLDVDANPMLAQAFGVRGIPFVKAFKDGKAVAEFTGALPEPQVRTWLKNLGPSPADLDCEQARSLERAGNAAEAAELYRRVLDQEPAHSEARAGLARMELALRIQDVDEPELRRRLEADPGDVELIAALADVEAASGRLESALQRLVDAVRMSSEPERDKARAHLVGLLEGLPPDDPRASSARKALSRALF